MRTTAKTKPFVRPTKTCYLKCRGKFKTLTKNTSFTATIWKRDANSIWWIWYCLLKTSSMELCRPSKKANKKTKAQSCYLSQLLMKKGNIKGKKIVISVACLRFRLRKTIRRLKSHPHKIKTKRKSWIYMVATWTKLYCCLSPDSFQWVSNAQNNLETNII